MTIDFEISLADSSHISSLAKLSEKTFRDAFAQLNKKQDFEDYVANSFTEKQIRSEILDEAATFFIAKAKDQWVGYAKLYQGHPPDCIKELPSVELSRLYAMQQYIGCGIGSALVKACMNFAHTKAYKSIWLGSWKKNKRGNAFYKNMQFEIAGIKTFVLGSDIQEDYVFAKSLK